MGTVLFVLVILLIIHSVERDKQKAADIKRQNKIREENKEIDKKMIEETIWSEIEFHRH